MDVQTLSLPGVILLKPRRFSDSRGYFFEAYNERTFRNAGIDVHFVQDNQSLSLAVGTIRGLHFQLPPAAQSKLVRVLAGSVYDVAVDLRVGSPTFGKWVGERLTAEGGEQLFIPRGLAHGFCTLEPNTTVAYKVDEFYNPASDCGIIWNDPAFKVVWPLGGEQALLSDKDSKLGCFADFTSPFTYDGA